MGSSESDMMNCESCGAPLDLGPVEFFTCQYCGKRTRNPHPPAKAAPPMRQTFRPTQPIVNEPSPTRQHQHKSHSMWFVLTFMFLFFVTPILACFGCVIFSLMLSPTVEDSASRETASVRNSSDPIFARRIRDIKQECVSRGEILNDQAGVRFVVAHRLTDRWGTLLAYQKIDDQHFKIKSLGPDKIVDTDDDQEMTVRVLFDK